MGLRAGIIVVELDLERLGFDQRSDLQTAFVSAGRLPKQIRVTRQLNLVRDLEWCR
jgi:hypothetical protein